MLQLALLLLGCALSRYLWTINRTVAGFILAFTLFGVASYTFFTFVATLSYHCPYQTPPSIITRVSVGYIVHSDSTFARSMRSLVTSLTGICSDSVENLRQIPRCLQSGARGVVGGFGRAVVSPQDSPGIPLAIVAAPVRIFEDIRIDWDGCKADTRCIAWILYSTTDSDVMYSAVRFATDTIWYPEIAGALSPHVLADLFFECLLDGRAIPHKLEHASAIGMALTSVLNIRLSLEPENEDLRELCERIDDKVRWVPPSESRFALVVTALKSVVEIPLPIPTGEILFTWWGLETTPEHLSTSCKLWLSRVTLQMLWRWRGVQHPTTALSYPVESICKRLMADGDQILPILNTNCVLTMAISLGLSVDIHDLYIPSNKCVPCPPSLWHSLIGS